MHTIANANLAFQSGQTTDAMIGYVNALLKMPDIANTIIANISRTRQQYLKSRNFVKQPKVVVCGWELSHNAAGRAHTLAEIYKEITCDVQIVGSIFPRWGKEIWEPIRGTSIPIHAFVAELGFFIDQALTLVAANPADIVHLSKPRAPNIFFGIFYKLFWGAKVIVDIDDEELCFVKAKNPITITEYLKDYNKLPSLDQLTEAHWTRIAIAIAHEFDAITVSNSALQSRYGGEVIGHARNPRILKPSPKLRKSSRQALGIQLEQKVVLFLGTPRPHKGLLEVAKAIQGLSRHDIVFVVAGSFGKNYLEFKRKLQSVVGVKYIFLENQPVSDIPKIIAIADCYVVFQDSNHQVSDFQIPAKLSDALAMKVPVICSETPALLDVIKAGAVISASKESLRSAIERVISQNTSALTEIGIEYFHHNLSTISVSERLKKIIPVIKNKKISENMSFILKSFKYG